MRTLDPLYRHLPAPEASRLWGQTLKTKLTASQVRMNHFVPFMAVLGAGGEQNQGSLTYEYTVESAIVGRMVANLQSRATKSGPWLPGAQHLNVKVCKALDLPEKCVPSNLSPRNPDSPLYPSGFFTLKWVAKYTDLIPTTVFMAISLEKGDKEIAVEIESLRQALRAARSHIFVVVDTTGVPDAQQRLAALRRATGLAPRTGLVSVDSSTDLDVFCNSLWSLLCAQAADFFAARSRETRHKRTSADQESDLWEARYTLKLAIFSEFKADYEGAIRLYQSAYECLQALDGVEYWLSMCAYKISLFLIYYQRYGAAWAKFQHHLRLSVDQQWQAEQYLVFANTLEYSAVEHWAIAPEPSSALRAVPRPGFLYLKAAGLAMDPELSKKCFQLALGDFSAMPHSKARALCEYGAWLETACGDTPAAAAQYEQALRSLPQNSRLHAVIASKLSGLDSSNALASFFLFYTGTGTLPAAANLGAIEPPLFDVSGAFLTDTAFIGLPLLCQLTIAPKFPGELTLESVKVQFSCTSTTLTHSEDSDKSSLLMKKKFNLCFRGKKRTFEFSVWPTEVGDCEFVDVQIHGSTPKLDQRLLVSTTTQVVTQNGVRHKWIAPRRFVEVLSRPHMLQVDTANVSTVLCAQENTKLGFSVFSDEGELANVKVTALWSSLRSTDDATEPVEFFCRETQIRPKETLTFEPDIKVPNSAFNVQIRTEYSTESNSSPVASTVSVEVDVVKPFRVNFALSAEIHREQWPNLFAPTDQCKPLPLIRRRWSLSANILSMCEDPILIRKRTFDCTSSQASIVLLQGPQEVNRELAHNEQTKVNLGFEAMRKDRDVRTFEAESHLTVVWSRVSTPETLNTFTVPKVRLSLPNQEPRVVLCMSTDNENGNMLLEYYIENATSHILNFAISMPSSPIFMIEGMRATTLRLLPFSRQCLKFTLSPLCAPTDQPLPDLRVFDTTYKKVLAIVPDSTNIYSDGGVLKVKSFSVPL